MVSINDDIKLILSKLSDNGYRAYLVGGCVRDMLLNITPNDYDITTNATPNEIISLFDKTVLTGKKHGTVTVIVNDTICEVTTFRKESEYINYRKPKSVIFTDDLKEDVVRRDFTVNSIAYNEKEGFIDYFNGINDLKNKILRTVKDPSLRFTEDALRILRAIRFSISLNFKIEENTYRNMIKYSYLIANISIERIVSELKKMFEINPYLACLMLNQLGIFKMLSKDFVLSDKRINLLSEMKNKGFENTLAILLYDNKHYNEILSKLKLSNELKKYIKSLIYGLNFKISDKKSIKLLLNSLYSKEQLNEILILKDLLGEDIRNAKKLYSEIIKNDECYCLKDLRVNGNDLKELGFSGKDIGDKLNKLLLMVIENNDLNDKNKLKELVLEELKNNLK